MSTITEEEHEQRTHAAVDKALKKQAKLAEADALRRIAEATRAPAPKSIKITSSEANSPLSNKPFVQQHISLYIFFTLIVPTLYRFLCFTYSILSSTSRLALLAFPPTSSQSWKRGAYVILTALRVRQ